MMRLVTAAIASAVLAAPAAGQELGEWVELPLATGGEMVYLVLLPDDYDPEKAYPTLLALPPSRQNKPGVREGLDLWWGRQAQMRGWIVISPTQVDNQSFFHGSERHIPQLLETFKRMYKVEGNKFHIAGPSASGRGAFRIATLFPQYFESLTAHPGYPVVQDDMDRLTALRDVSVYMFLGGDDHHGWITKSNKTHELLQSLGYDSTVTIFPGEKHLPVSLEGDGFMTHMDAVLAHRREMGDTRGVNAVLDKLHDAAAKANGSLYFSLFAPNAVFLGTAPEERWTLEEFEAYAKPFFDAGTGWTYTTLKRHVFVNPAQTVAWFDEALRNDKYGVCRGSGVLEKIDGTWRVAQYNLSFVVPNEVAPVVVDIIKQNKRKQAGS